MDPKEEADPIEAEPSATSDLPDSATVSAPVYVEYPGGGEEEDSVPPPPTSPFRKELPQAPQVQDTFQAGHSPSGPSRPPRVRGARGGKEEPNKVADRFRLCSWFSLDRGRVLAQVRAVRRRFGWTNLDHSSFPSLVESIWITEQQIRFWCTSHPI